MVAHVPMLRTPVFAGSGGAPLIVERRDQSFLPAVLDELRTGEGRTKLAATAADSRTPAKVLKLYQPIHRTFHLALLELVCRRPGLPRYDPLRVESAGVVVRRIESGAGETRYGWMRNGNDVQGWVRFASAAEEDADPDLPRRRPLLRAGNAEIDRRMISAARTRLTPILPEAPRFHALVFTETASPAFFAPIDVCQEARRTVLYALLPLASSETSDLGPAPRLADDEILATGHYPNYFRAGGKRALSMPGATVATAHAESLPDFVNLLRQLAYEFGIAEETPEAAMLREALNTLSLPLPGDDGETIRAADFFAQAVETLLHGTRASFVMPLEWPAVDAATAQRIFLAVRAALDTRLAAIAPREGRYEDPGALYRARLFVRVRCPRGCPPRLYWSDYTEPFLIAPWHDRNSRVPPARVALPDITSRNVKDFKPNVAFAVPPALQALLAGNSPKDFLENKASEKQPGFDLGWICSFSIPVITLCAFILLNIVLSLFNLFMQWLAYVKICIPFPKRRP